MRLILRIISDTDVLGTESPERNVHIKIKQEKVERVENKSRILLGAAPNIGYKK